MASKSNYKAVLTKTEKDMRKRINSALQLTALSAINQMIDLTPVKTGAAKFHWFVRALPDENFDKERTDPSGAQPKARAKRDVKLFKAGMRVWLVNAAPYFKYLEAGSSQQAPEGIVNIVKADMQSRWHRMLSVAFSRPTGSNE
jgi:hypothetical protein